MGRGKHPSVSGALPRTSVRVTRAKRSTDSRELHELMQQSLSAGTVLEAVAANPATSLADLEKLTEILEASEDALMMSYLTRGLFCNPTLSNELLRRVRKTITGNRLGQKGQFVLAALYQDHLSDEERVEWTKQSLIYPRDRSVWDLFFLFQGRPPAPYREQVFAVIASDAEWRQKCESEIKSGFFNKKQEQLLKEILSHS